MSGEMRAEYLRRRKKKEESSVPLLRIDRSENQTGLYDFGLKKRKRCIRTMSVDGITY